MEKKRFQKDRLWSVLIKTLIIMKLSIFIICLTVFSVTATETFSQNAKISLSMRNVTIEDVMRSIEDKSEFRFFYTEKLAVENKVSIDCEKKEISEVLDGIFKNTDISYRIVGRQIALYRNGEELSSFQSTQQKSINGKVVDSTGEGLPGVSVVIKGTTTGTITDVDGKYSLSNVPASAIFQFSFVGMKSQEVAVGNKTLLNITMEEESIGLEEVVAVGYGTQKKSNVTGSISSVKSEDLANRSTSSAASALQGKVAGVQVMNTSGAPGSTSTIRIRGFSSNGSSDPLYIVDGLKVTSIDYLDADNIENIEILKDGASTAIYGAEAGNGVVLVTTKSGKKGGGKIFVNTQNSFSSLAKKLDVLNADEFIKFMLEAEPTRAEELDKFYYNDPSSYVNNKLADTDWQNELFDTGYRQRYTVGFQGGTDKGSLFVSMNYLNHDGIIIGSEDSYKRMTGQINGSYQIKDWFNIGVTNSIETSKSRQVSENDVLTGSVTSMSYILDPLTPVEYSDGLTGASGIVQDAVQQGNSPIIDPNTRNYYGVSHWGNPNPLAKLKIPNTYTDAFQVNGILYANITPIKNLVITSRLGYRFNNTYYYQYERPNWPEPNQGSTVPSIRASQLGGKYYQLENFANYSFDLGKNNFTVLAGTSFINSISNLMYTYTNELQSLADNYHYLDYSTSTANDIVSGNTNEKTQLAYYGRLGWNYGNKYNIQFNFRADSYDAAYLDLQHNWGYFPSVSAGWTITNEKFMQSINRNILSSAKVRVSYGKNGSISNLGGYMYASNLNAGAMSSAEPYNYYMNSKLYTGIYPSVYLANPKLRWEESKQFDAGIDIRLFKDRMSLTADYFNKNTDGLLIRSSANLTTGTNYVFQNVGVVNNHGFEFDMEWKDVIKDFKYGIKTNIATVSNNVDKYKGSGVRIQGSSLAHSKNAITYFEEGYPIWYLRGYKVDHIDPSNGKPIYKDLNTDGNITEADQTYMGSGIPDFTYGATLSLAYKNFDILLNGTGAYGNKILYGIARANGQQQNRAQFIYDERWTPENTTAKRASAYYNLDPNYLQSDAFVFSGSYFKIKQIQLGYNLPKSTLRLIDASEMRVYVSMDDFFTFTKYPGSDPEVRPNSTTSMSVDFGGYPAAKSVMFGVNLTF